MRHKLIRIVVLCTILILPAVMGRYSPHIDTEPSLCPFLRIFHFPCPGCGLTKSIIHLYRGDWAGSFGFHRWGIPFVAFCVFLLAVSLRDLPRDRDTAEAILNRPVLWRTVGIGVLVTYLPVLAERLL